MEDDCYYVNTQVPPDNPSVRVCPDTSSGTVYIGVGGMPVGLPTSGGVPFVLPVH